MGSDMNILPSNTPPSISIAKRSTSSMPPMSPVTPTSKAAFSNGRGSSKDHRHSILMQNATVLMPVHGHTVSRKRSCRCISFTTFLYVAVVAIIITAQMTQSVTKTRFVSILKDQFSSDYLSSPLFNLDVVRLSLGEHYAANSNETEAHMAFTFSRRDRDILRRHAVSINAPVNDTRQVEDRKTVIVTVASYNIREMLSNLMCYVYQSTRATPILFALDRNMSDYARRHRMPSIAFHEHVQVKSANETTSEIRRRNSTRKDKDGYPAYWGTQKFSGISNNKLVVVYHILKLGYDVILSDVDVTWCRNMVDTFSSLTKDYPDFDMFMQSNRPTENSSGQLNTGFYYAKSNEGVIALFESLARKSPKAILNGQDDQTFFWGHTCRGGQPPSESSATGVTKYDLTATKNQTICQWNHNKMLLMFLPLNEFPNGAKDPEGRGMGQVPNGYYRDICREQKVAMWHVNYVPAHLKETVMKKQNVWITEADGSCQKI